MSLFQCQNCGAAENTALALQGIGEYTADWYDWSGIEDRRGKLLCSACGPPKGTEGDSTGLGSWHGQFKRVHLPLGEFHTNREGNLEHTKTGSTDFHKWELKG